MRLARASRRLRVQAAEFFTKIRDQGIEMDVLDGNAQDAVAVLAAASLGLADADPVGGAVAGAFEPGSVDEGFDEVDGVAVLCLPVGAQTAEREGKEMAGEMRDANPRQDEKACIVGGPVQALGADMVVPADKAVASRRLPSGGAEKKTRHVPTMTVADQVSEIFPDRAPVTKVMMASEVGEEG